MAEKQWAEVAFYIFIGVQVLGAIIMGVLALVVRTGEPQWLAVSFILVFVGMFGAFGSLIYPMLKKRRSK